MSEKVKVFKNPLELAEKLTFDFINFIKDRKDVNIALAGGSTPKIFYETLAKHSSAVNWKRIHIYWGDERCVPPDHQDSNFRMTKEALFTHINFPPENIHRIYGENDPVREALRYEKEITSKIPSLKLDWVLLGLGPDGHTASLFPNTENLKNENDLCVVEKHPESGQLRISLSLQLLMSAKRITFLVTGASKSEIIKKLLFEKIVSEDFPASLLYHQRKDCEWWLDKEAYPSV
ncbi:MAG: 6-phosphogluconolactonase [Candidatus Marinimicrobia bacterium]|nr:6-phosphogluconolactonase [Candidatus Neomarinimicrobiota bacterium]